MSLIKKKIENLENFLKSLNFIPKTIVFKKGYLVYLESSENIIPTIYFYEGENKLNIHSDKGSYNKENNIFKEDIRR